MKNIRYSTKARKDLKRYVGFPDKMRKLFFKTLAARISNTS